MHSRRTSPDRPARRAGVASALAAAVLVASAAGSRRARAEGVAPAAPPSAAATADAGAPARRPFPTREEAGAGTRHAAAKGEGAITGAWWMGTAGVAAALAVCGWASVAARRLRPGGAAGAAGLRVVGRTSLSPRHTVYLLRAGDRVLIVGTGPQGAPSLLGEMNDEPAPATPGRLDLRVGDDT